MNWTGNQEGEPTYTDRSNIIPAAKISFRVETIIYIKPKTKHMYAGALILLAKLLVDRTIAEPSPAGKSATLTKSSTIMASCI